MPDNLDGEEVFEHYYKPPLRVVFLLSYTGDGTPVGIWFFCRRYCEYMLTCVESITFINFSHASITCAQQLVSAHVMGKMLIDA